MIGVKLEGKKLVLNNRDKLYETSCDNGSIRCKDGRQKRLFKEKA